MSVETPSVGEIFTVRIYKTLDIAGDRRWANTYELLNDGGANYDDLVTAAGVLATFEQGVVHDTVKFDRALVSTYVADGSPYNPEAFVSIPLTLVGTVSSPAAAEVLPLPVALFLRRAVPTGRTGKLFLRQAVGEGDVSGRYGSFVLTSPSSIASRVSTAVSASGLDDYFAGGSAPLKLVMAGNTVDGPTIRPITSIVPVGVKIIKYDNSYFDRS